MVTRFITVMSILKRVTETFELSLQSSQFRFEPTQAFFLSAVPAPRR